jgi:N-acetylneuraminate synthase
VDLKEFAKKTYIIGELGINHFGSIETAKKLIKVAKDSGCNAVKFQKRDLNSTYTKEELDKPRESPFGKTNRDLKQALEFGKTEYDIIDAYCKELNIDFFVSCWDLPSVEFMKQYDCKYNKIASALITHLALVEAIAKEGKLTFIATGMSTQREIEQCLAIFEKHSCPYILMHCNSAYPSKVEDLNLSCIKSLYNQYDNYIYQFFCGVGFSNHYPGIMPTVMSVALGAIAVEMHITLDRSGPSSDDSASIEPFGLMRIVDYIREFEIAKGDGVKRVTETEEQIKKKLRRSNDYVI